jgi:hypothetical protein
MSAIWRGDTDRRKQRGDRRSGQPDRRRHTLVQLDHYGMARKPPAPFVGRLIRMSLLEIWIAFIDWAVPFEKWPRLNEWILTRTTPKEGP